MTWRISFPSTPMELPDKNTPSGELIGSSLEHLSCAGATLPFKSTIVCTDVNKCKLHLYLVQLLCGCSTYLSSQFYHNVPAMAKIL